MFIVGGAAYARLADISTNPGGLWPDEAAEALSAREIARNPGYRPVFLPEDGGREATYAYTVAAGFLVAGDSVETLRTVAALWGVAGVIAIWLLARRFGTAAGLAGAAWAAGSIWLIAISRDGMRNTITPLFGALALLALISWADRPSRRIAVVAGVFVALATFYSYFALRLLPLLVFLWLLWMRRGDRRTWAGLQPTLVTAGITFFVVAAPMLVAAAHDPQAWLGRTLSVTPFNPRLTPQEDVITHLVRTLGAFVFFGDPNPRHDVSALPLLNPIAFVIGVVGLATAWRYRGTPANALLLMSLAVFLLPGLIATEGASPHFLRALGLAAPLAVLVGLGSQRLWELMRPMVVRPVAVTPFIAIVIAGALSTRLYLGRPVAERYQPYAYDLVAIAQAARPGDAVVLDDFAALTVEYLTDGKVAVFAPGTLIPSSDGINQVIARSQADLVAAIGAERARLAIPIPGEFGPDQPLGWTAPAR